MARLSAAAGLVWPVVLMFVVLGAKHSEGLLFDDLGLGDLLAPWFSDSGSRPSPMRIFCRQNTALNVAIRDNAVVLATINSSDTKQLWYQLYSRSSSSDGAKSFSLVNAGTSQVVVIPSRSTEKLQLTDKFDQDKADKELWTSGTPLADGFFEVKVTKNQNMTLNGLWGNVHDGTFVGIFPSTPSSDNTLWNFTKSDCY